MESFSLTLAWHCTLCGSELFIVMSRFWTLNATGDEWYLWTLCVQVLFNVSVLTACLSHRKSESAGIGLLQL